MGLRAFASGLVLAAGLFGQKFNWQDYCFNHPGAPVCKGNDYAVKPSPRPASPGSTGASTGVANRVPTRTSPGTPTMITVGGIDWRFAEPFADALMGFNLERLAASPITRSLILQLGARAALSEADLQKILDGLGGVDQVAVSIRNNRVVVMLSGSATDSMLPSPDSGMKTIALPGGSCLVGHPDVIDWAARRVEMKGPPTDLTRMAEQWQSSSEFWVSGSAALLGPQARSAGLARFSLTVWIRDRLTTDLAFEFNGPPDPEMVKRFQSSLSAASLEGNSLHLRTSISAADVQQKIAEIVASPVGEQLAALVAAARYLRVPETAAPKQTKPVIYGLDDGPREVNQSPR